MISDDDLNEAIKTVVAQQIIAGLDGPHREAFLVKAITKALSGYELSLAVTKVVSDKARLVAAELCETEEWEARIQQALRAGFDDYLVTLSSAINGFLVQGLHGRGRGTGYPEAGSVLGNWPTKSG